MLRCCCKVQLLSTHRIKHECRKERKVQWTRPWMYVLFKLCIWASTLKLSSFFAEKHQHHNIINDISFWQISHRRNKEIQFKHSSHCCCSNIIDDSDCVCDDDRNKQGGAKKNVIKKFKSKAHCYSSFLLYLLFSAILLLSNQLINFQFELLFDGAPLT